MLKTLAAPASLREAMTYFEDPDFAHNFFAQLRWPNGVVCPACAGVRVAFYHTRRVYQCRECRRQFTAKLGTIFEDSPIGLEKWLPALWLLVNAKNGISSYELHRAIEVTQKTAWFMLGRIRLAMKTRTFAKMKGEIEADESFIGGKAKFMHKSRRKQIIRGTGGMDKTPVLGIMERGHKGKASRVRAVVVRDLNQENLRAQIVATVEQGSKLYTDTTLQYGKGLLPKLYRHAMINHAREYVRGRVHTNSLENFWSLFKRAIKGTYVSVDPFHLFRYVDEQVRRFNERQGTDTERFVSVLRDVVNKRLTYRGLTGKDVAPATT